MTNFAQPVSMPCTEEQYNEHLKDGLEKLGYSIQGIQPFTEYPLIVTNANDCVSVVTNTYLNRNYYHPRHFIPEYNPELFLAIAGMREGEEVHVGEWMICLKDLEYPPYYKSNELCRIDILEKGGSNKGEFGQKYDRNYFRKATLSELINHFKKEKMYTLEDLKNGKVACVNDGSLVELNDVLGYVFKEGGTAGGDFKFYRKSQNYLNEWHCTHEPDLPTQSVKLFHDQLPKKEHSFKFGDKVMVSDKENQFRSIDYAYFLCEANGSFIVFHEDQLVRINENRAFDAMSFKYCAEFPNLLKITRSEIAEWKGTDNFEIV